IRCPDGGLQYPENVAAAQVVTVRQDSSPYASQIAIPVAPPKPWVRPTNDPQHTPPPIADAELERLLAEMEERLRSGADEYNLGSVYRNKCTLYDQHDRSIDFFEDLVADRPEDLHARIDLGCAYVDKIPTQGGLAAIVSKGRLARKALDQLDWVIERYPELWIAYYARGMNHLHWPRALRHSDDAAADFEKCLAIQQPQAASAGRRDYYLRTYVGLGDAWAKAKKYDRARRAWRDGLAAFPEAPALTDRLAVKDDKKLLEYVEDARSLEQPIDTDLSFFDQQR
ncbi:MAG: hypothetical protein GY778_04695, partial [bacterium]|nr:hypothetical protein [bacterium]